MKIIQWNVTKYKRAAPTVIQLLGNKMGFSLSCCMQCYLKELFFINSMHILKLLYIFSGGALYILYLNNYNFTVYHLAGLCIYNPYLETHITKLRWPPPCSKFYHTQSHQGSKFHCVCVQQMWPVSGCGRAHTMYVDNNHTSVTAITRMCRTRKRRWISKDCQNMFETNACCGFFISEGVGLLSRLILISKVLI